MPFILYLLSFALADIRPLLNEKSKSELAPKGFTKLGFSKLKEKMVSTNAANKSFGFAKNKKQNSLIDSKKLDISKKIDSLKENKIDSKKSMLASAADFISGLFEKDPSKCTVFQAMLNPKEFFSKKNENLISSSLISTEKMSKNNLADSLSIESKKMKTNNIKDNTSTPKRSFGNLLLAKKSKLSARNTNTNFDRYLTRSRMISHSQTKKNKNSLNIVNSNDEGKKKDMDDSKTI